MRDIASIPQAEVRRLSGLLFDLDDTLLDHGALTEVAYGSLFRLREAGLSLVAVTGRPSGWGEVLARQWPIDAIVTENGAIALYREGKSVVRADCVTSEERARRHARMQDVVAALRRELPELLPADDVAQRATDFTFDIGEQQRVEPAVVERAIASIRTRGARAFASSVHLHVTLEGDDKASGTIRLLRSRFGEEATRARLRWAFIGDSENDAACFAAFRTTIGVANLSGRPSLMPRYVTRAERGAGFAEAARILCERRRS